MSKKVLVIDDEESHLVYTREILEAEGWTVLCHRNGFGATERVMRERPDLVLVDVNMPALSGESLALLVRSRASLDDTPVLLYSSNDEDTLRRSVQNLGVAGYICKGDPAALRAKVATILGGPVCR